MADSLWYPSTTPTGSDAVDAVASGVNLGTQLYFTEAGTVSAVAYYFNNSTQSGAGTVGIWNNAGTLLASKNFSGHTGIGWKVVTFDTPVSVSANTRYTVGWWQQAGGGNSLRYRSAGGLFTGNTITSPGGDIVAPATGATVGGTTYTNGLYLYSAFARPTQTFEGGGYWVDAVFTPTETGVTGSLAATESGSDTASFSGAVASSGSLSATETGADAASISGSVTVSGSLAATEAGSDTAAFAGSFSPAGVSGTLAAVEAGSDTAAFSGTAEGGVVILPQQPDGDAGPGRQFKTKRRKVEDDPRNAVQRLVARFMETMAPTKVAVSPAPVKAAPKALPVETAPKLEPVRPTPVVEPDSAEAERIRREIEEDEEAIVMMLLELA